MPLWSSSGRFVVSSRLMVKGQVRHLTTHRVLTPLMIVQGQVRLFTIRRAITPPYYHPGFTQRQVHRLTTHRTLTPLKANGHRRTGSVPTGHHLPSPYTQTSQSIPTFGTTTSDNSSCPYSSPRTGSSSDNSSRPYSPYVHRRMGSVPTGHRSPSPYTQTKPVNLYLWH
jgi:hypothetical protein